MCSNSAAPIARPSQMGVTGPQHLLLSHLNQVAEKAVIFAKSWEGDRHTYVAALWHDLGKYNPEVQKYLNGVGPQVNHAIVGALHADRQANAGNRLACLSVAFAIAGHHAGLADYTTASDTPQGTYKYRMKDLVSHALYGASVASPHVPVELLQEKVPPLPQWVEKDRLSPSDKRNFSFAFFTRMTFSVLVDADRLQTECDVDEATAALRGSRTTFGALRANFDAFFAEKIDTKADSPINRLRQQVRTQCRAAAKRDDMLFTLSAATGLGKTLSGLAFALDRVAIFADDDKPFTRVIYAAGRRGRCPSRK